MTNTAVVEYLYGSNDADTVFGNNSRNSMAAFNGDDVVYGGTGVFSPDDANDTIFGGNGADTLYGNGGNDVLYGGSDIFGASDGANLFYGGKGEDSFYCGDNSDTIFGGGSGYDPLDQGDDVRANAGDDLIFGNGGDDSLHGMEGADTIYGGYGNDDLSGGAGSDVLIGADGADNFWFYTGDGTDIIMDLSSDDVIHIQSNINGTGINAFEQLTFEEYSIIPGLTLTYISFGGTSSPDQIILGFPAQDLTADNFAFF